MLGGNGRGHRVGDRGGQLIDDKIARRHTFRPTRRHVGRFRLAPERRHQIGAVLFRNHRRAMHRQQVIAEAVVHAVEIGDVEFAPFLAAMPMAEEVQSGGLERGRQIGHRHLLAERPCAAAGTMETPRPIPVALAIRNQGDDVLSAAARHSAEEGHLLVKVVMLQHAGVEDQIVLGLAGGKDVLANEVGRQIVLAERPLGVVEGLGGEVHQRQLLIAGLGENEALPAGAAAGFQHFALGRKQFSDSRGQVLAERSRGVVDFHHRQRGVVLVPFLAFADRRRRIHRAHKPTWHPCEGCAT